MLVTVNEKSIEVSHDCTVAQLIEQLQLTGKRIAVEVNEDIVVRSEHPHHALIETTALKLSMRLAAVKDQALTQFTPTL